MAENRLPIFFRYRIWWHLLFWVVIFVVYWLISAGYQDRYVEEFYMNLIVLPARIIGTYLMLYLILPQAIIKKKFILFAILLVVHFVVYGFLIYLSYYITNPIPQIYDFHAHGLFNVPKILTKAVSDYALPMLASAIVIFKKWYLDELANKKLAEEKVAAELSFLKSQVHPHFLFNTLNNLYALTLIKSDKTPEIVLKLSDLLDYMIYNSNEEFVSLEKELEILNSYIELEKMRYNERLDLQFTIIGEVNGHRIAPLILLPFIENSFKHGASNDRTHPHIKIDLTIEKSFMILNVVNSVPVDKIEDDSVARGIGLKNVRRRLELIYPGEHELKINSRDRQYEVWLKIFWK
ncbi:MAG TPA: histidine kinase [Draconibacterium sp.]|nr:histidine kinase [Draconibacterium sp.]